MADLISSNVGSTTFGANYLKHAISQSDAGREFIVKVARTEGNGGVTDAVLKAVINYITTSHGTVGAGGSSGDSAFTVAAVGTADGSAYVSAAATTAVFLRVQGTGDLTVADADTGIANVAVSIEAVFAPAK